MENLKTTQQELLNKKFSKQLWLLVGMVIGGIMTISGIYIIISESGVYVDKLYGFIMTLASFFPTITLAGEYQRLLTTKKYDLYEILKSKLFHIKEEIRLKEEAYSKTYVELNSLKESGMDYTEQAKFCERFKKTITDLKEKKGFLEVDINSIPIPEINTLRKYVSFQMNRLCNLKNVTLQNIFLNDKNAKKLSIVGISSIGLVIIMGILEFSGVHTPNFLTWTLGAPFMIMMFGFILLAGPIMRVLKNDLAKDAESEKALSGVSGFLNFCVGMALINLCVLKPLDLGPVSHFMMPYLTIPFFVIMAIFVGNIIYSKAIMEPILKRFY